MITKQPKKIIRILFISKQKWIIFPILLLVFCFQSTSIEAKVSSGKATLNGQNSESLLTKFAISAKSTGSFSMVLTIPTSRGMYTDERSLKVHFFLEQAWYKYAKRAPTCDEKVRHAFKSLPVIFDLQRAKHQNNNMPGGEEDKWVANIETSLDSREQTSMKYWYITLDDCSLEMFNRSIKDAPPIDYKYIILDVENSNSHISADHAGMVFLHTCSFVGGSILVLYIIFKIIQTLRGGTGAGGSSGKGQPIHIALLLTMLATSTNALSSLTQLLHLKIYQFNGIGSYWLDAFSSHFEAVSDSTVAVILLLIGSGWTLPSDVFVANVNDDLTLLGMGSLVSRFISGLRSSPITSLFPNSGTQPAGQSSMCSNPATLLIYSIVLFHAALAQWGRTYSDDFDTYHSVEHMPGQILMYFRCILGLAFLVATSSLRNSGKCPPTLKPFLQKFMAVGLSWFVSLPFLSMVVGGGNNRFLGIFGSGLGLVDVHYRNMVFEIGACCVQACSLGSLVWLFTASGTASAFHRFSKVVSNSSGGGLGDLTELTSSGSSGTGFGKPTFLKFGRTKIRLD